MLSYLIALLAGALLPLAFAPIAWYPGAILSLALLLWLWLQSTAKQALLLGFVYGIACFGIGVSWIYISIHDYGYTAMPLALLITGLFIVILALFPALLGYCLKRFLPAKDLGIHHVSVFPLLWTVFEWLRTWLFTGFPWLLLGFSQTHSPLGNFAPLLGNLGVTYLTAWCASLLVGIALKIKRYTCLIALLALFMLGIGLKPIVWTYPNGKLLKVSLIQGNVPQQLKWQPEQLQPTLWHYQRLTQSQWQNDLIVWSEAAIPTFPEEIPTYLQLLTKEAKRHHAALITGIPIIAADQKHAYNSLMVLGNGKGVYAKRYLVPFGEYVPFERWLRGLLAILDLPMSEFIPGQSNPQLPIAAGIKIAPFICYEIAYSNAVKSLLPQAELLITISNDAWFGHSFALAQHLQIAQFQSLATGRYQLFVSNTGITAAIDPKGNIQARLPSFTTAVLNTSVYPMQGATPWIKLGDTPLWLMILLNIFLPLRLKRKNV